MTMHDLNQNCAQDGEEQFYIEQVEHDDVELKVGDGGQMYAKISIDDANQGMHQQQQYGDNPEECSSIGDNDEDYEDCDIDDLEEDEYIEETKEITLHDLYRQAN